MRTPRLLRARVPLGGEKKIWDRLAVFAVEGIPTRDLERRPSAYFRYCVDASCAEQIGELSSTVFVHHICPVERYLCRCLNAIWLITKLTPRSESISAKYFEELC